MDTTEHIDDKIYCFGEFRLCTRARELIHTSEPDTLEPGASGTDDKAVRGNGDPSIEMEPKVLDLLIYLLENRERVVEKSELHQALWDDRPLSDTVLSHCVMKARKALDDDGKRQTYIRTVRGHGYRFIADATSVPPEEKHSIDEPTDADSVWPPIATLPRAKHVLVRSGALYIAAASGLFFALALVMFELPQSCLK